MVGRPGARSLRNGTVLGMCRSEKTRAGHLPRLTAYQCCVGGSLYQDIVTENPHALSHVDPVLYDQHRHALLIEENSRLAKLYGDTRNHFVNSIHHQAIKRLGRDSEVEAVSESDS